ncbi:hypothetical protein DES53_106147 [Roseimicrobium gellanilyticum]|uniref:Helix-turn-helix protein n=1 Tax=Roseimicrobium gellanilyticum TaxID=748857 RepID=A0A366HK04_9BACT|nr:hypothetical protein [Roseimicrobium gellanilyticum]RBP42440.1 hypothetical protein DES53_106147 [Roseimicrobium gellanilyticum]
MADITSTQLAKIVGCTPSAICMERHRGRLQGGEKRPGVRGVVFPKTEVIKWLRYKCLSHLIEKLP